MVKSARTCSQWQRRRTKSPSPHWLTPPRSRTAARWPIQEVRRPNSVEIVSSLVERRPLLLLLSVLLLPCGRVINEISCTSESCAGTETHGKGGRVWCSRGKTRPDQTRRTPSNPGNRTAPQIKMQPGHSICVPLPSSRHNFSRSSSTLMANGGGAAPFRPKTSH